MIETPALFPSMTAYQNMEIQRIQRGIPDKTVIEKTLNMVGLNDTGRKSVHNFSLGMRQRLGIAIALLNTPEFLILDEPINGLDPKNIVTLRNMLKQIRDDNDCTIFVSSHILSELYLLATDFIFIHKGKIIDTATHEELEEKCSQYILVRDNNIPETVTIVEKHFPGTSYKVESDDEIKIYGKSEIMAELSGYLMNAGILVSELSIKEITLEDYFMSITGGDNNA